MNNYFSIGKLVSVFGLQGEFILKHSLGKRSALQGVEAIFLEVRKNSFIPYFVQKTSVKDHEHVFIKLEGVDTKEEARKLVQTPVYLAEEDFKTQTASSAPLSMLGFSVQDKQQGELGVIEEVIEMPMQVLVKVTYKEKEMLLPLNEQSLIKVDKKQQIVHVDLPDGLLDIYME
ncbi:ribosome maturation factor RimM [Chitinophaga rhizophila]|uniref:Ribosome maturation factor RimM n=1 Tax=Chitinophaga rhizophila TaxID=2866212 RepID=A0ABS7GG40_9BACT|nr:ribosome maturation factor RimM [Chitinophaga rhizophila]MBW8686659.1 ribosome maturation factor RimM [Chitinophaga rhizophila]